MAESVFTATFGGPVIPGTRIAVRDLSPALVALGELFADASMLVDPDRDPATLSIDSIEAGSTSIRLILEIAEQTTRPTHLLTTDAATSLRELQDVVVGPTGVLQIASLIEGRDVVDQAPTDHGLVRLALANGATVDANEHAAQIYLDRSGRRNVAAVVRPLQHPEVETLELSSPTTSTLITTADAAAFAPPDPAASPADEDEVEMLVDVAAPAFPVNNKWRLSNGLAGSFWATIGDGAFLNRVNAGEPFRKGDSLRCRFKVTRTQTPLGLQLEHHVIEVLQHVARGEQLRLDTAA